MYDRILLPTDGSETALNAVEHAVDLADRHDAMLHVLYVVDVGEPEIAGSQDNLWEPVQDAVRNQGNQHTRSVVETINEAGLDAQQAVEEGNTAAEGILSYVDAQNIDAIVIGTHGRSGPSRWVMGSVSEAVVRGSNVPVLVVPPPEE